MIIAHHGVKGQRWGVRKDRESGNRKKNIRENLTDGGILKKGTILTRMSSTDKENNSGSTWVNIRGKKRTNWDKSMDEGYADLVKERFGEAYQIDMKTKTDLILPSMQEKGKVFVENFLNNKKNYDRLITAAKKQAMLSSPDMKEKFEEVRAELKEDLAKAKEVYKREGMRLKNDKNMSVESIEDPSLLRAYSVFVGALYDKKIRNVYVEQLSKKGYNAATDDNDWTNAQYNKVELRQQEASSNVLRNLKNIFNPFSKANRRNEYSQLKENWRVAKADPDALKPEEYGDALIIFDRSESLDILKIRKR